MDAESKKGMVGNMDNKPKQENREAILNSMLPPREWVEQGKPLNAIKSVVTDIKFQASTTSST